MRRRRLRGKEVKKRRTMVVLSLFGVTFLLASGYAAFSTSLGINAKGNLKEKANTTIGGKKVYLSTSGDGLYTDPVEQNRYVYRGANPDNYICLEAGSGTCSEGNLYRIIAEEADGSLKIIKNTSIGGIQWDLGYSTSISGITVTDSTDGTRYSSTSTDYCYNNSLNEYYGCKSWGSNTSTYDSTGNNKVTSMPWEVNGETKALPMYESYLNVYLNGGKYINASNSEITITGWISTQNSVITSNIIEHIFNIGPLLGYTSGQTLITDIYQEKAYTWKGKVGLMNPTDYVRASINSACSSFYAYGTSACYNNSSNHNWIFNSEYQWTISPYSTTSGTTIYRTNREDKYFGGGGAFNQFTVRPTFFLKSTISLTGKGTNDANVYRIA